MTNSSPTGALTNLRVIELGHAVAAPFAGALLGDLGADVIKVEPRERGDSLRNMGPQAGGVGLWWSVAGRNKRSIALDLKTEEGVNILRQLAAGADVLIENYRPGVMDRLGLGWEVLHELNPDLVMLSISGFGQTGPKRTDGGFGKIAEAFSGATNLTGYPDLPPVHPGYSVGDAVCGLMGAFGVLAALHARATNGQRGQWIDLAIYESLFRMIEWQLPLLEHAGLNLTRTGPDFPFAAAFVTTICPTASGDNVVISAATAATIDRLDDFLRDNDAHYAASGPGAGAERTSRLTDAAVRWCASHTTDEVIETMDRAGLIVGPVNTPADIMTNPQFIARENIVRVDDERIGSVPMPSVVPRMSATPGSIRWAAPELGQHSEEILTEVLNFDTDSVEKLRKNGVI